VPAQQPLVVGSGIRTERRKYVDEGDGPTGRPLRHVFTRAARGLAVAALIVTIAACSSDNTGAGTPYSSPSASLKLQVYRLGQRAATAKGNAVVLAYDASVPATSAAQPQSGMKFVAIDVEGCAGSNADETTGIDPGLFYLLYQAEPSYPIDPGVKEPSLHKTVLAPGRCARGWITFEIPTTATSKYVYLKTAGARVAWILGA
jgi:hypothetical protein